MRIYIATSIIENSKVAASWTNRLRKAGYEVFSPSEVGPPGAQEGLDFPEVGDVTVGSKTKCTTSGKI